MSFNTLDMIELAQNNDESSILSLIDKFNPLLKKYAYKLNDIDAYPNIHADFIEFILHVDIKNIQIPSEARIVSYISTSIYHNYIRHAELLNKSKKTLLFSDLSDALTTKIETQSATYDKEVFYNLEFAFSKITSNERELIHLLFYEDLTITEAAKLYNTSRQAINQKKIKILRKMKYILSKYEEGLQ